MTNPLDLLNPSQYSHNEEQTKKRLEICGSCEFFFMGICKKCGCVMKLKTKLQEATCPLGKW